MVSLTALEINIIEGCATEFAIWLNEPNAKDDWGEIQHGYRFTMQSGDTLTNDTGNSYVVSIMPSSTESHTALLAQLKALLGEPEEVYGSNVWN
jgi:hypothetical protein